MALQSNLNPYPYYGPPPSDGGNDPSDGDNSNGGVGSGGTGGDGSGGGSTGGGDAGGGTTGGGENTGGGISIGIGGDGDGFGGGDGLINVDADTSGLTGGSIDGINVSALTPDSVLEVHAPGIVDATVGDGTIGSVLGDTGSDGDGHGLVDVHADLSGVTDALDGAPLGGTIDGISVEVLNGDSILDVQAPDILHATVGDDAGSLGDVLDGNPVGALDGITVEALNSDNLAEAHAPGLLDATIGEGSTLGSAPGGLGDVAGLNDIAGTGGNDPITVSALNGANTFDAHVPDTLDATVGGAELGSLLGGVDLGGIVDGIDPSIGGDGGLLDIGNALGGLDIDHLVDNVSS